MKSGEGREFDQSAQYQFSSSDRGEKCENSDLNGIFYRSSTALFAWSIAPSAQLAESLQSVLDFGRNSGQNAVVERNGFFRFAMG